MDQLRPHPTSKSLTSGRAYLKTQAIPLKLGVGGSLIPWNHMDLQGKGGVWGKEEGRNRYAGEAITVSVTGDLCSWPLVSLAKGFVLALRENEGS